jgi:hypothetical protein
VASKAMYLLIVGIAALPLTVFAQGQVEANCPPEVDQALRARVNEFFQYHVDGTYRKALDLVAEDTQDEYFAGGKMKLNSFELNSVKFTDNCTRAIVTNTVKRDWQIRLQNNEVVVPMVTTWKIEKDKWVWYHDTKGAWLTPMGPSNIQPPTKNADGTVTLPKNISADAVAAAAKTILSQSSLSKSEVFLDPGKASEDQVTFTNGVQGSVRLSLEGIPDVPGFTAKLDRTEIGGGDQVRLSLAYKPPRDAAAPEPFILQVVTEPLNQAYPVKVNFRKPQ